MAMADNILTLKWISDYNHSNDVQSLFTWRRGFFGFKLRKEIKRKIQEITQFGENLSSAQKEFSDLAAELKSIERRLAQLGKQENSESDPMFAKLDTEKKQLERSLDTKERRVANLKDSLMKSENDLGLMQSYSNGTTLTTDQAMREWTGKDGSDTSRARGNLPEREARFNEFNEGKNFEETAPVEDYTSENDTVTEEVITDEE
tara:strand:+ start:297 stop:908 length:612 start_codon:yes stop_codon:yes gene_type:complete